MVAPISVSSPSSTAGSSASCWALLKRWISSRKRIVGRPEPLRRSRARSITPRISALPAIDRRLLLERPLGPRRRDPRQRRLPRPGRPVEDRAVRACPLRSPSAAPTPRRGCAPARPAHRASAAASAPPAAHRQLRRHARAGRSPPCRTAGRPLRASMRESGEVSTEPPRCCSGETSPDSPHPPTIDRWLPPRHTPSASTLESFNPATGELVGTRPDDHPGPGPGSGRRRRPDPARLGRAAARRSRAAYMRRAADALLDDIDEVAELLVREQGKPRAEAYTMELLPTVDALHWCAKAGPKILADEKVRMTQAFTALQERPLLLRADRRRRRHRPLELPLVDPLRRGRDRADGRQRRRPQAGQPDAAAGRADPPTSSRRAGCPRAWSGSSTAAAPSATRWPSRAPARSSSPARSRSAARSARSAPSGSRARCSSSAARTR